MSIAEGTRVGVDVGGTFTDLVALGADGAVTVRKVPSTPDDPARAMIAAAADLTSPVHVLVHGTTIATNTLLERTGARVVLVTTAGFEDLLWLGRQDRSALYELAHDHPPPLVVRDDVVGVHERSGPDGVITPLTDEEIARVVRDVVRLAPDAVAISLLFAFRHPAHERALSAAVAAALPAAAIVASHEVLPVFREYERTATTTAEAYLRPRVARYVADAARELEQRGAGPMRIMTSSGGSLAPPTASLRAAALALSGPAGGVVGARLAGLAAGERNLLTLDMGGTSADAGLVMEGGLLRESSNNVGGVPLALPAILIETVSAGGGSLAWVDEGGALRVGPRSAGAVPGPACYGRGGTQPTVTDACVVLGWLDPAHPLPGIRLDGALARTAVETLAPAVRRDLAGTAMGIVAVAAAVMARALRRVSVSRGVDPRAMTLVVFGGAGPLFGCALADSLGMRRVLIPPHPGALSAFGLAAAPERAERVASLHREVAELDAAALAEAFEPVTAAAVAELPGAALTRMADCRYAGQGYEVSVPVAGYDPAAVGRAFVAAHRARYGYGAEGDAIEMVNVRVAAVRDRLDQTIAARPSGRTPVPGRRQIRIGDRAWEAAVWPLDELPPGTEIAGPAVLAGGNATALVEPGWTGVAHETGAVLVTSGKRDA